MEALCCYDIARRRFAFSSCSQTACEGGMNVQSNFPEVTGTWPDFSEQSRLFFIRGF